MQAIVQYVSKASVSMPNQPPHEIKEGYLIFICITTTDTESTAHAMASKITKLRVIPDQNGKLNLNLNQIKGHILLIPQFTLCADTSSNRPSFSTAAPPAQAIPLIDALKEQLITTHHLPVQTGFFGEQMTISAIHTGPITIPLTT
jgi:D-tyrosyl-tRNA(Tyr) deacylase